MESLNKYAKKKKMPKNARAYCCPDSADSLIAVLTNTVDDGTTIPVMILVAPHPGTGKYTVGMYSEGLDGVGIKCWVYQNPPTDLKTAMKWKKEWEKDFEERGYYVLSSLNQIGSLKKRESANN